MSRDVFWEKYKYHISTFVYPRNRIIFSNRLSELKICNYRGALSPYRANKFLLQEYLYKAESFMSSFKTRVNLGPALHGVNYQTHFIRFSLPEPLWNLHLKAVFNSIRSMGANDYVHLWWHPHNLAIDPQLKLKRLKVLATGIKNLCELGEHVSCNMAS